MPQYVTAIRTSEGDKKIDYTALANKEHAKQHSASGSDPILLTDIGAAKATHANQHSSVGSDPITPSDIGAAKKDHASQHATGGADPIAPASIGAASLTHASQHAAGGADAITPEMIGTYTKEQILSADTATAFGLGEGAEPKDFFQKIYDDGGTYRVGDVLSTVRTDLGDKWLLCDGGYAPKDEFPELKKLISTPATKIIRKDSDLSQEDNYYHIEDIAYYDGMWVAVGYEYQSSSTSYPIILTATDPAGEWTFKQLSTSSARLNCITCHNGTWVAGGRKGGSTYYACAYITTDPTGEWTESLIISTDNREAELIACYDNVWVARIYGSNGTTRYYTTSNPYGTWTLDDNLKLTTKSCYVDGTWIQLGSTSVTIKQGTESVTHYYPKLTTMKDPYGTDLKEIELPYKNINAKPVSMCWNGYRYIVLTYDGGLSKGNYIYTSTSLDGTWTVVDVSHVFSTQMKSGSVFWCDKEVVFVSDKGAVTTAPNATFMNKNTWKEENVANDLRVYGVAYSDDTWVVVGLEYDNMSYSNKNICITSSALIQLPNISLDRVNTYIKGKQ